MQIEKPTRGVVIIRNILSLEEQLRLIDIVERKGNLKDANGGWNYRGWRGRNFCGMTKYPADDVEYLARCAAKFKEVTEKEDNSLIWPSVTHLLTLWYPDTKGIGFHVDGYGGNDGDIGAPVYSLTLGNSCIFEYKLIGADRKSKVELNSGDLIVFGGPQREMGHSVPSVRKGSFDEKVGFDARINLTFRTCTNFTEEDEAYYQTDVYAKRVATRQNKY